MTVNERLKELRRELGLSQEKFAAAISISDGYLAALELGYRRVNDRIVKLICDTYHVNRAWMLDGEGEIFQTGNDHLTELAAATFRELKPAYQEYILRQIDQLLELQKQEEQ